MLDSFSFHRRSITIDDPSNIPLVESNSTKLVDKQSSIDENPDSVMDAILEKDKELKRVLEEKEMLLSRLLNIPPSQMKDSPGFVRQFSSISVVNVE